MFVSNKEFKDLIHDERNNVAATKLIKMIKELLPMALKRIEEGTFSWLGANSSTLKLPNQPIGNEERVIVTLERFQNSPEMLDEIIPFFVSSLTQTYLKITKEKRSDNNASMGLCYIARMIYVLCKIRGQKTIALLLPSDYDLLGLLIPKLNHEEGDIITWEERHLLLLWLGVIVLVPFPLDTQNAKFSLAIYNISTKYLENSGKEREAAAFLLARLLCRPDSNADYLKKFLENSTALINNKYTQVFRALGTFQVLNWYMKYTTSDDATPHLLDIFNFIRNKLPPHLANDTGLRKLHVKLFSKVAIAFLTNRLSTTVPSEIEQIISLLLTNFDDNDYNVRFTSAKSLAKVTAFLSDDLKKQIFNVICNSFDDDIFKKDNTYLLDTVNEKKWQGDVMALGQLALYNSLPFPSDFNKLLSIITCSLSFEQKKVTHSVGQGIRDSACFVTWAFFRNINLPEQFLFPLFNKLLAIACYDREIGIRRAAVSSLQECLGRQSNMLFLCNPTSSEAVAHKSGVLFQSVEEMGIAVKTQILQIIDYNSMGQRAYGFLEAAPSLHKLGFNVHDYLLEDNHGIRSFDPEIRKLSAKSLGLIGENFKSLENVFDLINKVFNILTLSNAQARHGCIWALAELVEIVSPPKNVPDAIDLFFKIRGCLAEVSLSPLLEQEELGTLLVEAYAHLLSEIVSSEPPDFTDSEILTNETIFELAEFIMSNYYNNEPIMEYMLIAVGKMKFDNAKINKWCTYITTKTPHESYVAFIRAMSHIPRKYYTTVSSYDTFKALELSCSSRRASEAHIRAAAIRSMCKMWWAREFVGGIECIIRAIRHCLGDYSANIKGDVGSWARFAALEGIRIIITYEFGMGANYSGGDLNQLREGVYVHIARITLDKLIKLRFLSFSLFRALDPVLSVTDDGIADIDYMAVQSFNTLADLNEVNTVEYFQKIIVCIYLSSGEFVLEVMKGFVMSCGGATDSVMIPARDALLQEIKYSSFKNDDGGFDAHRARFHFILIEALVILLAGPIRYVGPTLETLLCIVQDNSALQNVDAGKIIEGVYANTRKSTEISHLILAAKIFGAIACNINDHIGGFTNEELQEKIITQKQQRQLYQKNKNSYPTNPQIQESYQMQNALRQSDNIEDKSDRLLYHNSLESSSSDIMPYLNLEFNSIEPDFAFLDFQISSEARVAKENELFNPLNESTRNNSYAGDMGSFGNINLQGNSSQHPIKYIPAVVRLKKALKSAKEENDFDDSRVKKGIRSLALIRLIKLTKHNFPKVRETAVNELYLFTVTRDYSEQIEVFQNALLNTNWLDENCAISANKILSDNLSGIIED